MGWSATPPATYDGSSAARSGVHNDCFLASRTDVGTYSEDAATRARQRNYVMALSKVAPFGGETCSPDDDSDAQPRSGCADILSEGAQFSLTYLNRDYYRPLFHDKWEQERCMAQVQRSMGYRWELVQATHTTSAAPGGAVGITFDIKNTGWARLYNARPTELVLKHRTSSATIRLPLSGLDATRWLPGVVSTATGTAALPNTATTGPYDVYLAWPDAAPAIRNDARFAIRPANADVSAAGQAWNAGMGAFKLGTALTVQ
ncbi:DUF4832 domain-containing protein [Ottowia testudinis]|uniref:DUF4832 domain-containing protein n=1 Tax=Ottowia testudinis TaxID=2816950 RepID=A0A975H2Q8_9BURK|nr:DUF4832 domain-containing protein [Ottowia testudinis]QTD44461.1 DUF4832 domain-containing protein [Ottowia testudinis]